MAQESDVARYRLRAQRLRVIAADDGNRHNRELLERVAQDYEQMAREVEARNVRPNSN
jgi:hypothetical protein